MLHRYMERGWEMATNEVALVERTVPIKGTPEHVAAVLRAYEARGHLLSTDDELRDGVRIGDQVVVKARLLMRPDPVVPDRKPARSGETGRAIRSALLFAGIVMASAALMIWLIASAVSFALGRIHDLSGTAAGALVIAVIAWILVSVKRGHPCRGLHCPSCPDA